MPHPMREERGPQQRADANAVPRHRLEWHVSLEGHPNMGDRLTTADVDAIKAYVGTRAQADYAKQQSGGTR